MIPEYAAKMYLVQEESKNTVVLNGGQGNDSPKKKKALKSQKVVLLGESGVGKSSIAYRFIKDEFSDFYEATIGASFFEKELDLSDGRTAVISLWDTAGQERFASLASFYYRGALAALVVYDVTQKSTFERAKQWISELNSNSPASTVITLIGNKIDLPNREIKEEDGKKYAEELGTLA